MTSRTILIAIIWAVAAVARAAEPPLTAEQAAVLRAALQVAPSHGLAEAATPVDDDSLVEAAVRYTQAVRAGRLQPLQFLPEWADRPAPFDARGEIQRAMAEGRLREWLDQAPPPSTEYAFLRQALLRYRAIAADGGWPTVPAVATLRLGVADPLVPLLRRRLAIEDPAVVAGEDPTFDEALKQGLVRFQARHGLPQTGAVDKATVSELNVSAEARIDQIVANMERRRWEARSRSATRIDVNIAAQQLVYTRDGRPDLTMLTVVGRPTDKTPIFSDAVEAVVFNPPWNVPSSIATKEILPKLKRDPGYLARNRFVVQPGPGTMAQRLQQRPGPESALGLVKFDLPNSFNVYLHDTPAKSAFARAERALSHGCIRLQSPLDLARRLLGDDPRWTPASIKAAVDTGVTTRARLAQPTAMHVGYWTAFAGDDGAVAFRRDLHGWDARLLGLLGQGR